METFAAKTAGRFVLIFLGAFGGWLATNTEAMHNAFCSGSGYQGEM